MINLENLINSKDSLLQMIQPDNTITQNHKKLFLEKVRKFNNYNKLIYRKYSLKDLGKMLSVLSKIATDITMNESSSEWFDKVSIKRDMKALDESVKIFNDTANQLDQMQQRLESCYDEIGSRLSKYFEIDELPTELPISNKPKIKLK